MLSLTEHLLSAMYFSACGSPELRKQAKLEGTLKILKLKTNKNITSIYFHCKGVNFHEFSFHSWFKQYNFCTSLNNGEENRWKKKQINTSYFLNNNAETYKHSQKQISQ